MKNFLRKTLALMGTALIIGAMLAPAQAALGVDLNVPMGIVTDLPLVVDKADVLTDYQEDYLSEEIEKMVSAYNYGFAILTSNDNEGKDPGVYSADFLYDGGYGIGRNESAAVFYISFDPSNRCWRTTSIGECEKIFNADVTYEIDEAVDAYIRGGDYFEAFKAMLGRANEAFSYYESYGEYQGNNEHDDPYDNPSTDVFSSIFGETGIIAGVVGIFAGLFCKKSMTSKMKVSPQVSAKVYVKEGSFNLRSCSEHFLYTTLTKVPKPKQNKSGSGGSSFGGGHSSGGGHFSSGGRSF